MRLGSTGGGPQSHQPNASAELEEPLPRGNVALDGRKDIDPMPIVANRRDLLPKMNLYAGHLGDGYPLCGQLPNEEGLFIAAGYNGNGMPQCFGVGKAIAQMIRGEHAAVDPWVRERMDPGRFDELSAGAFDSSEAF